LTVNHLSEFVSVERSQYQGEDNNLFAFAAGQALRYYDFLSIIKGRHEAASKEFVMKHESFMASLSGTTGTMSDEQTALLDEIQHLTTKVHLETESFYIFAKILLDKIAQFVEIYFGQAPKSSLASHDRLTKNWGRFRSAKGLDCPLGLSESLVLLKERIADYRDKQVEHLRNPRALKSTSYHRDTGQTRLVTTHLYPTERDQQVESQGLPELMKAIDSYMRQVIELITLNREKTRFRLRE
jgi:hypothetical protein